MRRTGETEGVRQALGNVAFPSGGGAAVVWQQRVVVPPLSESELKASEDERHGRTIFESGYYVAERRKRPPTEGQIFDLSCFFYFFACLQLQSGES